MMRFARGLVAATLSVALPSHNAAARSSDAKEVIALFEVTRDAKANPEVVTLVNTLLSSALATANISALSGDALDRKLGGDASAARASCGDNATCLGRALKKAGCSVGVYGLARYQAGVVRLELFKIRAGARSHEPAITLHLAVPENVESQIAAVFPSVFGLPYPAGVKARVASSPTAPGSAAAPSATGGNLDDLDLVPLATAPPPEPTGGEPDDDPTPAPPTADHRQPASAPSPLGNQSRLFYAGLGAGGLGLVFLGAASFCGLKALSEKGRLEERDAGGDRVLTKREADAATESYNANAARTRWLLAGAGLALLGGAGVVAYDRYWLPRSAAIALGRQASMVTTLAWSW